MQNTLHLRLAIVLLDREHNVKGCRSARDSPAMPSERPWKTLCASVPLPPYRVRLASSSCPLDAA